MGLALLVGVIPDLEGNDEEGLREQKAELESLNRFLTSVGLPKHDEPSNCDARDWEMFGYSGLHYLRRYAAYLDSNREIPGPGDQDSSGDPLLEKYFEAATGPEPGFFRRLMGTPRFSRGFDHLILHSDAEGYYLPQDFEQVQFPDEEYGIPGGMVGSTVRLKDEVSRLRKHLGVPSEITSNSEELWEAADSQGEGPNRWQQFGVESFTCVALHEACAASLDQHAALIFS